MKTPKYLHRPYRILWFESDELMLMFFAFIGGIYISIYLLPVFLVLVIVTKRLKSRLPRGFIRHISYFLGIFSFTDKPSFFESTFNE